MERAIRISVVKKIEQQSSKKELEEMTESVKEVSDSSFQHEVLESERPVLVDFWAAWCGPCRMLAPTVEAIAEQYAERAAVVKLNVDDNPSIAEAYGIRSIPTLILISEGKEVERVIGATSKESISRLIEKYSNLPSKHTQLAQVVSAEPTRGEING
jgi:thioredoxin 1